MSKKVWFVNWRILLGLLLLLVPDLISATDENSLVDCNYEDTCKWQYDKEWIWTKEESNQLQLKTPAPRGYEQVLMTRFSATNNSQSMTSPSLSNSSKAACFSFRYYLKVDRIKEEGIQLNLIPTSGPTGKLPSEIWSISDTDADLWYLAQVNVDRTFFYKLNFVVSGLDGLAAFHDFKLVDGPCSDIGGCDFESGTCGWQSPNPSNKEQFQRIKPKDIETSSGSKKIHHDHTSHSPNGYFMYISSSDLSTGATPELESPTIGNIRTQCFSFWYLRTGTGISLALHKVSSDGSGVAFRMFVWESNHTNLELEWIPIQINIPFEASSNSLIFKAQKSTHGTASSSLAIDDIQLNTFACKAPISCHFDGGTFCGWEPDLSNQYLWSVGVGRVLDATKLTFSDPVNGNSPVAYTDFTTITGSSPSRMGMVSEFIDSPQDQDGACITMYYIIKKFDSYDKDDSFTIDQIDINGNRIRLFTNSARYTVFMEDVYIPNPKGDVPYRLEIRASTVHPATYIAIEYIDYWTTVGRVCGMHKLIHGPTTVVPTTPTTTIDPTKSLDCDFEQGNSCVWKMDTQFKVGNAAKTSQDAPSREFMPTEDHTTDNTDGQFAYLYAPRGYVANSFLQAKNPFFGHSVCFGFYYYFYALEPSTFSLESVPALQSETPVIWFRAFGANEIRWREARFTIEAKDNNQTYYMFHASIDYGLIAIDDIWVTMGPCPAISNDTVRCDFEQQDSSCILEPIFTRGPVQWKWLSASSIGQSMVDHTTHSRDGHFYGVNLLNVTSSSQSKVMIQSHWLPATTHCVRFSYYLSDLIHENSNCLFFTSIDVDEVIGDDIDKFAWKVYGNTYGLWLTHQQRFKSKKPFQLVIGIITNADFKHGQIFIDDLIVNDEFCQDLGQCDFENGDTCQMESLQPTNDSPPDKNSFHTAKNFTQVTIPYLTDYIDVMWRVFSPIQSNHYIGWDHTHHTSNGKYLLLTGDAMNDRAVLVTNRYELDPHRKWICLSFAVYKPNTESTLEVYQSESGIDNVATKIWDTQLATRSDWIVYNLLVSALTNRSNDMYFYIIGTVQSKSTFVAIDDVMTKYECPNPSNDQPTFTPPTGPTPYPITTTTPTPNPMFRCTPLIQKISANKVCDWKEDCPNGVDELYCGSCDFADHNLCNYQSTNYLTKDYRFQFSDMVQYGPAIGSHKQSLFMVASDSSGIVSGQAEFHSPLIHQSYVDCTLKFFYQYDTTSSIANVDTSDSLNLYLYLFDQERSVPVWQSSFQPFTAKQWNPIIVNLHRISHPFRVEFRASKVWGYQNYHAIDDIHFVMCQPPKPNRDGVCTQQEFACANRVCIDSENVCDSVDHCGDGSDERQCYQNRLTTFEDGFNSWGNEMNQNWKVVRSDESYDLRLAPPFDHTSGYSQGSYLFVSGNEYYRRFRKPVQAEIESPAFVAGNHCKIRLFILKNSPNSTLFISLKNAQTNERTELDRITSSDWNFIQQDYFIDGDQSSYYKIVLTAILNTTMNKNLDNYIAIDDISFSPDCTIVSVLPTLPTTTEDPHHPKTTTLDPIIDHCKTVVCDSQNGTNKKICVKVEQFCDFKQDCKNGIDENNCGDCNFDDGQACQWKPFEAMVDMKVIRPASDSPVSLPKVDGSRNSSGGYIAFFSASVKATVQTHIRSPQINGQTARSCKFVFNYSDFGNAKTEVSVLIVKKDDRKQYIHSQTVKGLSWHKVTVPIGQMDPMFRIQVDHMAQMQNSWQTIGYDNFKLVDCNPYDNHQPNTSTVESLNCDFEQDLCGWDIDKQKQFQNNWFRTNDPKNQPGIDHTSLQDPLPAKHGMWLSTKAQHVSMLDTNLMSNADPLAPTNQTYCISFWYYYFGSKYSNFSLSITPNVPSGNQDGVLLWQRTVPETRNWNLAYIEIPPQSSLFYINFLARVTSLTVVGLDDIRMYKTVCPVVSPMYCDFEVNNCDWKVAGGMAWKRQSGNKQYSDHSTGTSNGHFMTDDPQSKQPAVMTKRLSTLPNLNQTLLVSQYCFNFYYLFDSVTNTDGQLVDTSSELEVCSEMLKVKFNIKRVKISQIYNYNQLKQWTLFSMDVRAIRYSEITIQANVNSPQTRLLIDDIQFYPYRCQVDGNCDFENGMCGWQNSHQIISDNGTILWLRIQPIQHTQDEFQTMSYDHTTGTNKGNYLVLPGQMQLNSTSILKSPVLFSSKINPQACLTLYYFVRGTSNSVIALNLHLIDLTATNKKKDERLIAYLNASDNFNLRWTQFEQQLNNVPVAFALKFTSQLSTSSTGEKIVSDIGMDDIQLKSGPCSGNLPTTTTQSPDDDTAFNCDFDHSKCNWQFDTTVWNLTNFDKQRSHNPYAPPIDHNTNTFSGHYLLFNDIIGPQQTYQLISKVNFTTSSKQRCLTFWYFEDGENQFEVSVYLLDSSDSIRLGTFGSTLEMRHWKLIKINIPSKPGQLRINYSPSPNAHFSEFAIDDIKVSPGQCQHLHDFTYTFSDGYDDLQLYYVSPANLNSIGRIYQCRTGRMEGVPKIDHTSNSINGSYFLFINAPKNIPTDDYITYLAIENVPAESTPVCIRFAYQLSGKAALSIVIKSANSHEIGKGGITYWSSRYPKSAWTVAEVNTQIAYNHRIIFYMEKRFDTTSFVALDDLTILSQQCQKPISCDFENYRYCSYTPYNDNSTSKYNFGVFNAPPTDLSWPGPKYDHTTDGFGGGYLFMTAYRSVGTFTKLISKLISGPKVVVPNMNYCLTMWTQLTKPKLQLTLYLVRFGNLWADNNRTVLLTKRNFVHTEWLKLSANLGSYMVTGTGEVQIIIEGQIESGSGGLIAIDDINVDLGECLQDKFVCEDGTKLSYDKVCNFIMDCKSGLDEVNCGNCTFESDSCGWTSIENKDMHYHTWQVKTANDLLLANHNSPQFDGDGNKNGHFLIQFGDKQEEISRAELAINSNSPNLYLKMAYKSCTLQFDYSINQTTGSSFELTVRIGESVNDLSTLYSVIPEISYDGGWRKARAHVGERFSNFIIDFNSFLTDTVTGFVALDNFKFINCSMPKPITNGGQCPSQLPILCKDTRICIGRDDICDLVNDCGGNGWDENGCSVFNPNKPFNPDSPFKKNCNFENGPAICSITTEENEEKKHDLTNPFTWRLSSGRNLIFNSQNKFEPPIDNSRRTKLGTYIVLEPKISPRSSLPDGNSSVSVNVAALSTATPYIHSSFYTPMLTSVSGQGCRMRFFYYTNGLPSYINSFDLKIFVRFARKEMPESTPLLTLPGNPDQKWTKMVAVFDSPTDPFQFVFTGTYRNELSSRLAIDDISYDNTSCVLSKVTRTTITTTTSTSSSSITPSNGPFTTTSTEKPDTDHSNHSDIIVAAVLIPILLLLTVVGAFFGYRQYKRARSADDIRHVIKMSTIQKNAEKVGSN